MTISCPAGRNLPRIPRFLRNQRINRPSTKDMGLMESPTKSDATRMVQRVRTPCRSGKRGLVSIDICSTYLVVHIAAAVSVADQQVDLQSDTIDWDADFLQHLFCNFLDAIEGSSKTPGFADHSSELGVGSILDSAVAPRSSRPVRQSSDLPECPQAERQSFGRTA